jgi:integrase
MAGDVLLFPKPVRQRRSPRRRNLTEQRVAALTEEGFVFDAKVSGLAVRITPSGAKTYVFQRKVTGKPVRLTIGKCSGLRLDAARAAAERLNGQIAIGGDPRLDRAVARQAEKALTLGAAFDQYLATRTHRPATIVDYQTLWRLHVPDSLKRKPVEQIGAADVEKLKSKLLADSSGRRHRSGKPGKPRTSGKARTAAKLVNLLAAVLNKSGRWADNPCRDVQRPEARVRTRRLSVPEITAVLSILEQRRGGLYADLIAIALLTGARRGALCAMRWCDVHLEDKIWIVPATWSKNGKEVAIALTEQAAAILAGRVPCRGSSPWVWPSAKSACGHVVNPEKPLREILAAAGVSPASMHDLRRTLGSRLAMNGAGAATISAALGHLSQQSARAYTHIDVAHARDEMEKAIHGK